MTFEIENLIYGNTFNDYFGNYENLNDFLNNYLDVIKERKEIQNTKNNKRYIPSSLNFRIFDFKNLFQDDNSCNEIHTYKINSESTDINNILNLKKIIEKFKSIPQENLMWGYVDKVYLETQKGIMEIILTLI